MQCKSCGTELPKKAKVCPKCGELVGKQKSDNLKVIAVAGLVIALIGGLLPFVQNTDVELISDDGKSKVMVIPAWQGRVMTTSAAGDEGDTEAG